MTRPTKALAALFAIAACPFAAQAQLATNGINIIVEDTELLPGESTTIRLEGYFGGTDYAVAVIGTWLQSSSRAEGLSDPRLISRLRGPGTSPGQLHETGLRGILAGQINFPLSAPAWPGNPAPFLEVTYTAPTSLSTPIDIDFETRTGRFDVYFSRDSVLTESRLDDFADGRATIHVIPAPASAMLLLGLLAGRRRRSVAVAVMCVSLPAAALADTEVGGIIDADTTWTEAGSPYIVTETIQVTGNATLTIEPGVDVRFEPEQSMIVGPSSGSTGTGTLKALGESDSRSHILFEYGAGIDFQANAVPGRFDPETGEFIDGSILRHAIIYRPTPIAGLANPSALRTRSKIPYLDSLTVNGGPSPNGIFIDCRDDPTASIWWPRVNIHNARDTALRITGGQSHIIEWLTVSGIESIDNRARVINFVPGAHVSEGQWDLDVRGGEIRQCTMPYLLSCTTGDRFRFQEMTFHQCDGKVMTTFSGCAELRFEACTFLSNQQCIDASGERVVLLDCLFKDTVVAPAVELRANSTIERCRFESNAGPALAVELQLATVLDSTFMGNSSSNLGGAIYANGPIDLFDNVFERNSAEQGGAVSGQSIYALGNTYLANSAIRGGAVDAGRASLLGSADRPEVFIGNAALEDGGAVYINTGAVDLLSCRFERNTAARGGAVAIGPTGYGLAISAEGGTGTTMLRNVADIGPDIFLDATTTPLGLQDILAPCIHWGTTDPTTIADRIHDGADDPLLATVNFDPIGPCDCRPDLDGDGALTIFDFLAFQTAFDAGDLETADFDGDGQLTLFDFLEFQTAFDAGCA